ncbi:glycoside hydrolase family 88 protein [Prevotella sp. E13-17]|uniref:glycoside hydrolase family 88/105 protein n=1 Tax=Prevotella sp. E13-17 TaxID=2913616 RepID=UPI001EDC6A5B|nr:glycoside hydrolase family 88 protein [Prevotella sp. E13-17]UKK51196.1 glycoside hydrolase family 88 protein [Prevotella sp. E13-17]
MNKLKTNLILLALACGTAVMAQQVNDSNTPLHLMKPAYRCGYGVPEAAMVKQTMDRVLHYLQQSTPAVLEDSKTHREITNLKTINEHTQLRRGDFRLTSYEWGVTYSAMLAAYRATGDVAYRDYVYERYRLLAAAAPYFARLCQQGKKIDPVMRKVVDPQALDDAGAVCSSMIKACVADKSLRLEALIDNYTSYILNKEYRLGDGTFARLRPQHNTLWLDDMFMGIPTVADMGLYTGDARYYDQAAAQVLQFAQRMFVPEKQLFRHGWVEDMNPHPAYHWGRANGWAILTLCEVLDVLPQQHPQRQAILKLLQQHAEGLARLQGIDGYWHQLLDRPETYEETSCTAIFTYSLAHAINNGWLDAKAYGPIVMLGWHAVEKAVNDRGQVTGVCVGTGMGFDAAFYAYRPVHVMAAHGYGPVIWAGAEVLSLLQSQHPKMNDSAVHFYDQEINTDEPIFSVDGKTDF